MLVTVSLELSTGEHLKKLPRRVMRFIIMSTTNLTQRNLQYGNLTAPHGYCTAINGKDSSFLEWHIFPLPFCMILAATVESQAHGPNKDLLVITVAVAQISRNSISWNYSAHCVTLCSATNVLLFWRAKLKSAFEARYLEPYLRMNQCDSHHDHCMAGQLVVWCYLLFAQPFGWMGYWISAICCYVTIMLHFGKLLRISWDDGTGMVLFQTGSSFARSCMWNTSNLGILVAQPAKSHLQRGRALPLFLNCSSIH